jgi:acetyl-CoA synthetase
MSSATEAVDALAQAEELVEQAKQAASNARKPAEVWSVLHRSLLQPSMPFELHQHAYEVVYKDVDDVKPSWIPTTDTIVKTNIHKMMTQKGFTCYQQLYEWSIESRNDFWMDSAKTIGIQWDEEPCRAFASEDDPAHATYFPEGRLNIADSCFHKRSPHEPALMYAMESDPRHLQTMSFQVLQRLSNQIANALQQKLGLEPGDAVGICMPMTPESIAIYLGIVKAGCVVVSIADSFSASEIAMRCRLGNAKAVFTQDVIYRGAKFLPLYERVVQAGDLVQQQRSLDEAKETKSAEDDGPLRIIVLPGMLHAYPYPEVHKMNRSESGTWNDRDVEGNPVPMHESIQLRPGLDCNWHDFLHQCSDEFVSVKRGSMDPCNILFSSGTTGEPKAIVWSHSTPIKAAIDGYYHQDIQVGERVAWPTNIGWMMGPWLLFQMVNGASIGIFNGVTSTDTFCQFVDEAKISMLGVIPSLVKAWQARNATADCDWSCVRRFSSTGEASDPVNYLWLMSRVPGYAPVMEYCGGTEIGGSFLSSTLVQPNVPSMFASPVLGSQFLLLDSDSIPLEQSAYTDVDARNSVLSGEIALVPPSLGLSTLLLNRNHYDTYYKGMPSGPQGQVLRRHGDEIQCVRNSQHGATATTPYFRALGRCDDTMNIGGIKVSSVEIERVCNLVSGVQETAAIAVSHGGPCKLVIYVVLQDKDLEMSDIKASMQKSIKVNLNPLFGISDVVMATSLPRTASNKIMRRLLRDDYMTTK